MRKMFALAATADPVGACQERWQEFKGVLFPADSTAIGKCMFCGRKMAKQRMHRGAAGWFCDEEEADQFYRDGVI
ncbi:hypothetical protein [Tunturibacter empetritectus]|uniref:Uncharacterized protein n=1 Tax=Tunturiibacter empetritectus TaxID=3069691 RepID=A0A7W8MSB6_9BACT|nr:hypothetical protein [Edaphobacter lichenicola]MBB5317024.1 hypothetical protein [Edaphobacter lichenicola]